MKCLDQARWLRRFPSLLSGAVLALTVPLLGAQILAPADARHISTHQVVQLSASGSVDLAQDWLSLTLSTVRQGTDASALQNQLKAALETALAEARRAAVPGQVEVRTGGFNLTPQYGRDGKMTGWQGSVELLLEGRDFAALAALAGRIHGLTVASSQFSLSREARLQAEAQAQAQAIERYRAKAGEIAKGFGFASYILREIQVSAADGGGPRPRMMAMAMPMAAEAALPVEAGRSSVTVQVSGSVTLK